VAKAQTKGYTKDQAPKSRSLPDTVFSSSKTPMPGGKLDIPKYKCRAALQKGQKM